MACEKDSKSNNKPPLLPRRWCNQNLLDFVRATSNPLLRASKIRKINHHIHHFVDTNKTRGGREERLIKRGLNLHIMIMYCGVEGATDVLPATQLTLDTY